MLPVLIRTAVVEGVATATEVSTIGIAYCLVVGMLVYRQFDWRRAYPMLVETATLSGAILFIIGAATGMAWALTQSGFSQSLARAMGVGAGRAMGLPGRSRSLAFIVLGSVLEGIPAMVLFGPLLFPIARQIGVNEVHYAIVIILAMGIGLFAPPFGLGYYTACTIGKVHPDVALRRSGPTSACSRSRCCCSPPCRGSRRGSCREGRRSPSGAVALGAAAAQAALRRLHQVAEHALNLDAEQGAQLRLLAPPLPHPPQPRDRLVPTLAHRRTPASMPGPGCYSNAILLQAGCRPAAAAGPWPAP